MGAAPYAMHEKVGFCQLAIRRGPWPMRTPPSGRAGRLRLDPRGPGSFFFTDQNTTPEAGRVLARTGFGKCTRDEEKDGRGGGNWAVARLPWGGKESWVRPDTLCASCTDELAVPLLILK